MPRQGFELENKGEMADYWHGLAKLQKGNINGHDQAIRVRGELKRDYVKKLEDLLDDGVKRKEHSGLQKCLTNGHIARRWKMRSLIPVTQQGRYPNLYSHDICPIFLAESLET